MQQPELIQIFIEPLEKKAMSYFVTGSVASIFYGEPRLTHDIDLVIHLTGTEAKEFPSLFPPDAFYCPPEEVIQVEMRRKPFGHFNLIHHATGLKADIYTSSEDKLHAWAFSKRKRIELRTGTALWLAPPEYLIIRKLEFFREGGSEKHLEDIRKMLPQVESSLDRNFLNTEIAKRGLTPFASKVFA